jgi:hypothetical protein
VFICVLHFRKFTWIGLSIVFKWFLHPFQGTDKGFSQPLTNNKYRAMYDGTLMAAGGFTPTTAQAAIEEGHYDLIA